MSRWNYALAGVALALGVTAISPIKSASAQEYYGYGAPVYQAPVYSAPQYYAPPPPVYYPPAYYPAPAYTYGPRIVVGIPFLGYGHHGGGWGGGWRGDHDGWRGGGREWHR